MRPGVRNRIRLGTRGRSFRKNWEIAKVGPEGTLHIHTSGRLGTLTPRRPGNYEIHHCPRLKRIDFARVSAFQGTTLCRFPAMAITRVLTSEAELDYSFSISASMKALII